MPNTPSTRRPFQQGDRALIAIIALGLAFSETLGKSAQTVGIELNIKASDTWNFFQAKTIRQTTLRIAADGMTQQLPLVTNDEAKAAMAKQAAAWRGDRGALQVRPQGKGRPQGADGAGQAI